MPEIIYDTIIVGAGPGGIMAAINIESKRILILDKNQTPLNKLRVAAKGRGNYTNLDLDISFYPGSPKFLLGILGKYSNYDLMDFFQQEGLDIHVEGTKVYPDTQRSQDLINTLLKKLDNKNIKINQGKKVVSIEKLDLFLLTTQDGTVYKSKTVVVATGGLTYPTLGGDMDILTSIKKLGHKIIPVKPVLSGINTLEVLTQLQGVALPDIQVTCEGNTFRGEILFTHFGLSGPAVVNLSAYDLEKNSEVSIDFLPDISGEKIVENVSTYKTVKNYLSKVFPQRFCEFIHTQLNDTYLTPYSNLSKKHLEKIVEHLKNYKLTYKGVRGLEHSMVTSGGVDYKEINPKNMESKLVKGLFFSGEVINIHGITGGYNLQFAFSSGYVAGLGVTQSGSI